MANALARGGINELAMKHDHKSKNMTYSEYRKQFDTVEEFMAAFGKLSEEEARKLISAEPAGTTVKACAMTTWQRAAKEAKDD